MSEPHKLLAILAHPDDESLGAGSTLAKYAADGVETYLICATKGERGWMGAKEDEPGLTQLGIIREQELLCAAETLGIKKVFFLNYIDGDLDQTEAHEAIAKIVTIIRIVRPQVAFSFGPDGVYGHPDHIAISQFSTSACVLAADSAYVDDRKLAPHLISKFYYFLNDKKLAKTYASVFGQIQMEVDGVARSFTSYEDWMFTTIIDGSDHWRTALKAVNCHQSQVAIYGALNNLPEEKSISLWGKRSYYRAFSLVNGGRRLETDFFEGLK
jgi:LmbE family N-acetylglucosaminyl deacetylase